MKKNTALMELILELRKAAKISGNPEYASGLEYAALSAESKLSKEREDIENSYKMGGYNYDLDKGRPNPNAEDYFNNTFNQLP